VRAGRVGLLDLLGSSAMTNARKFQQILGIRFFVGDAQGAIDLVSERGGLVVVPSAPTLKDLASDHSYRESLLGADFAIADSTLMVVIWNLVERNRIPKLSGLKYLRALVERPEFRIEGNNFWVMASPKSARRNLKWLRENGVAVAEEDVYIAPLYGSVIDDKELLRRIEERRPKHVVMGVGGGVQERVGYYLKQNLSYMPAIHCIGAAIAFLSGDQVGIPSWVDALGMGWLWRIFSDPKRFGPRYWGARFLAPLLLKYRDRLPAIGA
jgi:N-acetylglucosaminyldiphosphoundecaprenol N-acetyl-beta-D-mannosaminyltransferase